MAACPGGARRLAVPAALLLALALVALLCAGRPAAASAPPTPWDGVNPFTCAIQDAGKGTVVRDPGADPYCVSFDKTGQNLTELGLVDFLSKEPARVAAATPKCFYFQEDHWRGSVVQSDGRTLLYEFHGHYFFNKATGDGGAWVSGFSLAGQTYDPAGLPGFPPAYGQYFGPGTGGVITHDQVPADPGCAAKLKAAPTILSGTAHAPRCVSGAGRITRRALGPLTLGLSEDQVRAAIGPPAAVKRGFLRYCVSSGASLLVGQSADRSGSLGSGGRARTVMLLTSSPAFSLAGAHGRVLAVHTRAAAIRRALRGARTIGRVSRGRDAVGAGDVVALVAHRRVVWLGIFDVHALHGAHALLAILRRAG